MKGVARRDRQILADRIVQHLAASESWPTFRTIERELAPQMDVEKVAKALHPNGDWWSLSSDSELRLRPDVLLRCSGVEGALAPFIRAIPVIVDRYLHGETPQIVHTDLLERGWTNEESMRVYRLMSGIAAFTRGGGATPSEGRWHWDLGPETKQLADVRTARDYLRWWKERDKRVRPRKAGRIHRKAEVPAPPAWILQASIQLLSATAAVLLIWWFTR